MVRVHTNILIEEKYKEQAKRLGINLSQTLEKTLEYMIQSKNKAETYDYQLSKQKAEELISTMCKIQIELENEQNKIQTYEDNMKKMEIEQIKKAKEAEENAKHCIKCGNMIQNKYHKFAAGNVCNGCFMVSSRDDIKKWNTKQEE